MNLVSGPTSRMAEFEWYSHQAVLIPRDSDSVVKLQTAPVFKAGWTKKQGRPEFTAPACPQGVDGEIHAKQSLRRYLLYQPVQNIVLNTSLREATSFPRGVAYRPCVFPYVERSEIQSGVSVSLTGFSVLVSIDHPSTPFTAEVLNSPMVEFSQGDAVPSPRMSLTIFTTIQISQQFTLHGIPAWGLLPPYSAGSCILTALEVIG